MVEVELDVAGVPGEMMCDLSVPTCTAPGPGKYVIATDETGRYMDCEDDVGLFPESGDFSASQRIGIYCLQSPVREPISCPVLLTDPHTVDAAIPWVDISLKNTSDKAVKTITIRYASVDRTQGFTTSKESLAVAEKISPHQSFVFSTIAASDKILDHQKKSNGVGTAYFLEDVQFADGTEWKADPADHACGTMDDRLKKFFAQGMPPPPRKPTLPSLRQ